MPPRLSALTAPRAIWLRCNQVLIKTCELLEVDRARITSLAIRSTGKNLRWSFICLRWRQSLPSPCWLTVPLDMLLLVVGLTAAVYRKDNHSDWYFFLSAKRKLWLINSFRALVYCPENREIYRKLQSETWSCLRCGCQLVCFHFVEETFIRSGGFSLSKEIAT